MPKKLTYDDVEKRVNDVLENALKKKQKIYYQQTGKGFYFTLNGYTAYFLPHEVLLSNNWRNMERFSKLEAYFNMTGYLVTKEETGKDRESARTIRKLYNSAIGNVYADNAFFRNVPKCAAVYVSGKNKPIHCGIMENGTLHIFKLILPIRFEENRWLEKGGANIG